MSSLRVENNCFLKLNFPRVFTRYLFKPLSCPTALLSGVEEPSDLCLYQKLIGSAQNQGTTDLRVRPTILGERHNTTCLAQVSNISSSNLSLGHVTRALCSGILDNIASMMPADLLEQAGVRRIVASGSAIAQNQVLRQELERTYPLPVVYGLNAESAVGAAMVLCDRC